MVLNTLRTATSRGFGNTAANRNMARAVPGNLRRSTTQGSSCHVSQLCPGGQHLKAQVLKLQTTVNTPN